MMKSFDKAFIGGPVELVGSPQRSVRINRADGRYGSDVLRSGYYQNAGSAYWQRDVLVVYDAESTDKLHPVFYFVSPDIAFRGDGKGPMDPRSFSDALAKARASRKGGEVESQDQDSDSGLNVGSIAKMAFAQVSAKLDQDEMLQEIVDDIVNEYKAEVNARTIPQTVKDCLKEIDYCDKMMSDEEMGYLAGKIGKQIYTDEGVLIPVDDLEVGLREVWENRKKFVRNYMKRNFKEDATVANVIKKDRIKLLIIIISVIIGVLALWWLVESLDASQEKRMNQLMSYINEQDYAAAEAFINQEEALENAAMTMLVDSMIAAGYYEDAIATAFRFYDPNKYFKKFVGTNDNFDFVDLMDRCTDILLIYRQTHTRKQTLKYFETTLCPDSVINVNKDFRDKVLYYMNRDHKDW